MPEKQVMSTSRTRASHRFSSFLFRGVVTNASRRSLYSGHAASSYRGKRGLGVKRPSAYVSTNHMHDVQRACAVYPSFVDVCFLVRAMDVLEGALRLYKPEEIAMSFNGGKVMFPISCI